MIDNRCFPADGEFNYTLATRRTGVLNVRRAIKEGCEKAAPGKEVGHEKEIPNRLKPGSAANMDYFAC